ncbi:MAG: alpha/beta fold hydrolase, partial [Actinobacteria bacterium]|nr:alpha/beta fold hydrolase [Actinomycetota bacterium]
MVVTIDSGGLKLRGHLARPPDSAATEVGRLGLVLCHGFPSGPRGALTSAETYPELANKLASEAGWVVLSFNFRGTGESEGDFSLGGWLADLRAAIDHLLVVEGVAGVWLAGFSAGGALAICAAGEDERIGGVAALCAPGDFDDWAADPRRFLTYAREVGVVRSKEFPPDFDAWARELRETRPVSLAGKIPPRPLLLVHGTEDDVVPVSEARALADAARGQAELRTITGAGHRLRH